MSNEYKLVFSASLPDEARAALAKQQRAIFKLARIDGGCFHVNQDDVVMHHTSALHAETLNVVRVYVRHWLLCNGYPKVEVASALTTRGKMAEGALKLGTDYSGEDAHEPEEDEESDGE